MTCTSCEDAQRTMFSGSSTFSRPECSETQTGNAALYGNGDCSYSFVENQAITIGDMVGYNFGTTFFSYAVASPTLRYIAVSDTSCIVVAGTNSKKFFSTGQEQLSDEYTTAQLLLDTELASSAAIMSAWSTTPTTALHDVSSDELTITIRDIEIDVVFSIPAPGGCRLEFDVYLNGGLLSHECRTITPDATHHIEFFAHPAGEGELSVSNFAITTGACP